MSYKVSVTNMAK